MVLEEYWMEQPTWTNNDSADEWIALDCSGCRSRRCSAVWQPGVKLRVRVRHHSRKVAEAREPALLKVQWSQIVSETILNIAGLVKTELQETPDSQLSRGRAGRVDERFPRPD